MASSRRYRYGCTSLSHARQKRMADLLLTPIDLSLQNRCRLLK